jgi:hypothetical protein
MVSLQDTVRAVVEEFIQRNELFTALDVSNEVKSQLPNTRHREVRDAVRNMFTSEIETQGYTRSPITVTLGDGTTAEALLYHPLSDTWDLDNKYDQQKRQQTVANPVAAASAAVASAHNATTHKPGVISVHPTPNLGRVTLPSNTAAAGSTATPMPGAASVTISATTSVPMPTARDLWNNLFSTQPSLFPTK